MLTTYDETVAWIHSLLPHGIKPGTKRVEWMLEQLEHPERKLISIHIGGTNGKGSTVTYLRHILEEEGNRVGTFTSPYIERFNERISVNGEQIADEQLVAIANRVQPLVDKLAETELKTPTEFEVITMIAIVYFAEFAMPDFALFEVGLGGRLDSTNVISPLLTAITNVDYDHTAILGNRIEEIAFEKAGIIKQGTPVISAVEKPEARAVIQKTCAEKHAPLYLLDDQFYNEHHNTAFRGERFSFYSPFSERQDLVINMSGLHQVKNASLALMAADVLQKSGVIRTHEKNVRSALQKSRWPGRFEVVSDTPTVILDGAHNPDGVKSLAETVKRHYRGKNIYAMFACLRDKDVENMLHPLYEVIDGIMFTTFSFQRAAEAQELYEHSSFPAKSYENDWQNALTKKLADIDEDSVLLVTGSLYFISEVRNFLKLSKKI
jgi:dihydrofolate synthase/folylpolyglutamate synthase